MEPGQASRNKDTPKHGPSVQTPVPYVRVSLGRLSIGESRIGPPVIDTPAGVDTDAVVMMSDVGEVMVSGSASARRHTSARA